VTITTRCSMPDCAAAARRTAAARARRPWRQDPARHGWLGQRSSSSTPSARSANPSRQSAQGGEACDEDRTCRTGFPGRARPGRRPPRTYFDRARGGYARIAAGAAPPRRRGCRETLSGPLRHVLPWRRQLMQTVLPAPARHRPHRRGATGARLVAWQMRAPRRRRDAGGRELPSRRLCPMGGLRPVGSAIAPRRRWPATPAPLPFPVGRLRRVSRGGRRELRFELADAAAAVVRVAPRLRLQRGEGLLQLAQQPLLLGTAALDWAGVGELPTRCAWSSPWCWLGCETNGPAFAGRGRDGRGQGRSGRRGARPGRQMSSIRRRDPPRLHDADGRRPPPFPTTMRW